MTYPGGKNGSGVYQQIINVMPPHSVYIEPFLGGGAVMRLKWPAALNIGVDLDAEALRLFRKSRPTASETARSDRASSEMNRSSSDETDDAARFVLECGDGIEFLAHYPYRGGELVYCDPPYMHETRGRKLLYKHEMTDAQHFALLTILLRLPCRVIVSGYWTPLYSSMLLRWATRTFQTTNRAGRRTTEHLWMNYREPVELHDYRYLGGDFRERERIKRKKARWVARLGRMPVQERRALLAAIAETEDDRRLAGGIARKGEGGYGNA